MTAPLRRPICPECGERFETSTPDREFCSVEHRAAFHNRSSKIGRVLVPLAMAWREGRNVKGNTPEAKARRASAARAFADMCRMLDAEALADREAGRTAKLNYVRRRRSVAGDLWPSERAASYEAPAKAKGA